MPTPRPPRPPRAVFLDNVSAKNMGRLFAVLIHPERVLTPAEKRLADHVMESI